MLVMIKSPLSNAVTNTETESIDAVRKIGMRSIEKNFSHT